MIKIAARVEKSESKINKSLERELTPQPAITYFFRAK